MPEFVQEDLSSVRSLIIHFEDEKYIKEFAELIGQTITPKTKYIWYPKKNKVNRSSKMYIDES